MLGDSRVSGVAGQGLTVIVIDIRGVRGHGVMFREGMSSL